MKTMIQDDKTTQLGLPLPSAGNKLADDVLRLRDALTMIDALLHGGGTNLQALKADLLQRLQVMNEAKLGKEEVASIAQGGTGANNQAAARDNLAVPSRTGAGASGTWGVNISGTAAAVPFAGVTGKPSSLDGYGIQGGIFSDVVTGRTSGIDYRGGFSAVTTGGAYATMWIRRGAPFYTYKQDSASSYGPSLTAEYAHVTAGVGIYRGVYSIGVLNNNEFSPGSLVIHHVNEIGGGHLVWLFNGTTGDFTSPGNVTAYSDARIKCDVRTIHGALDMVRDMRGVFYVRKDDAAKRRNVGVIAQEIREVLPEVVFESKSPESEESTLSVSYGNIVGVLIEAIKELKSEVDALKGKP